MVVVVVVGCGVLAVPFVVFSVVPVEPLAVLVGPSPDVWVFVGAGSKSVILTN